MSSPLNPPRGTHRALDCVRDTDPILTVQDHGSGRIGASFLPGHDASPWGDCGGKTQRHLATVSVRNAGSVVFPEEPENVAAHSETNHFGANQPTLRGRSIVQTDPFDPGVFSDEDS